VANMAALDALLTSTADPYVAACIDEHASDVDGTAGSTIDGQRVCAFTVILRAGTYAFSKYYRLDNLKGEFTFTSDEAGEVIFDGGRNTPFFHVQNGHLKVQGIKFMNAYAGPVTGFAAYPQAAIHMAGGTIEVAKCTFQDNRAATYGGGAIYMHGPKAALNKMHHISESKFVGNSAGVYGGDAIYACDTFVLLNKVEFSRGSSGSQTTYNLCEHDSAVTKIQYYKSDSLFGLENECRGGTIENANCSDFTYLGINKEPWANADEWRAECLSAASPIGVSAAVLALTYAVGAFTSSGLYA